MTSLFSFILTFIANQNKINFSILQKYLNYAVNGLVQKWGEWSHMSISAPLHLHRSFCTHALVHTSVSAACDCKAHYLYFRFLNFRPEVSNTNGGWAMKKSVFLLAMPTYQFFSRGNRPWHPGLLVMCTCKMEMFH